MTTAAPPHFHTLKNNLGHLCSTYARTSDGTRLECLDGFTVPIRELGAARALALREGESR